jgi:hypothetical protein
MQCNGVQEDSPRVRGILSARSEADTILIPVSRGGLPWPSRPYERHFRKMLGSLHVGECVCSDFYRFTKLTAIQRAVSWPKRRSCCCHCKCTILRVRNYLSFLEQVYLHWIPLHRPTVAEFAGKISSTFCCPNSSAVLLRSNLNRVYLRPGPGTCRMH